MVRSIATLFRIELVRVQSSCSGAAENSQPDAAPAAQKAAQKSARSGRDADVYQVTVTPIKARPSLRGVALDGISGRCATDGSRRRCPAVFAFTGLCFGRHWQRYCKNKKRECDDQKLFHDKFHFLLKLFSRREICAKFFGESKAAWSECG